MRMMMNDSIATSTVNFWQLPLSKTVQRKLGSIDRSRKSSRNQKMALVDKLLASSHDPARGLYVPLSSHVFLPAKLTDSFIDLPQKITADVGSPLCFFGNPLLLPNGYGRLGFEVEQ